MCWGICCLLWVLRSVLGWVPPRQHLQWFGLLPASVKGMCITNHPHSLLASSTMVMLLAQAGAVLLLAHKSADPFWILLLQRGLGMGEGSPRWLEATAANPENSFCKVY